MLPKELKNLTVQQKVKKSSIWHKMTFEISPVKPPKFVNIGSLHNNQTRLLIHLDIYKQEAGRMTGLELLTFTNCGQLLLQNG